MVDTMMIFWGLAIALGFLHGILGGGGGRKVEPSKNLISFLFWDN